MAGGLFDESVVPPTGRSEEPLAHRMRPRGVEEFVGQVQIMGAGKVLRRMIEEDALTSLILWGPPGSGKTTLAMIMAGATGSDFISFSAVTSGVQDIRRVVKRASETRAVSGRRTILFCDEIHRFNKAQQDAFLPHVEKGTIILVGATTENPSFEVNSPLLSRSRVFVLEPLSREEVRTVLERALADVERGLGRRAIVAEPAALEWIIDTSDGDARRALNLLELAARLLPEGDTGLRESTVGEVLQGRHHVYDKGGEEHYNLISAFHKSLRGGDPDAALYWLARMLESGEDPLYIARRLVRFASEDVGLADPDALGVAMAARDAVHFIGMPEGDLALAQATVHLAAAPKSNALYRGYGAARRAVRESPNEPVPLEIRNAPTGLMRELGYGRGYRYPHDAPEKIVAQEYLPTGLRGRRFYRPTGEGRERDVGERLERWGEIRWRLRDRPVVPEEHRGGEE